MPTSPDFFDEPVNSEAERERLHALDRARYAADRKIKRGYDHDGSSRDGSWPCARGAACDCSWCQSGSVLKCGACDPSLSDRHHER